MPRVSITIPDKNPQPYRFNLDHKKVTIGRSKDSDIIIDEPSVSGLHATMERVDGGYILRDRGSTNGITLDDELMQIIDLRNGDDVKVGDVDFDYELGNDELEVLDEEEFVPHEQRKEDSISNPTTEEEFEEEEEEEEEQAPPKRKKAAKKMARPAAPSSPTPMPHPMMGSQSGGNGFLLGVGAFILGALAFFAGINNSYVRAEEKESGRKNVSLLKDMKEGKPTPTEAKEGDQEEGDQEE